MKRRHAFWCDKPSCDKNVNPGTSGWVSHPPLRLASNRQTDIRWGRLEILHRFALQIHAPEGWYQSRYQLLNSYNTCVLHAYHSKVNLAMHSESNYKKHSIIFTVEKTLCYKKSQAVLYKGFTSLLISSKKTDLINW